MKAKLMKTLSPFGGGRGRKDIKERIQKRKLVSGNMLYGQK